MFWRIESFRCVQFGGFLVCIGDGHSLCCRFSLRLLSDPLPVWGLTFQVPQEVQSSPSTNSHFEATVQGCMKIDLSCSTRSPEFITSRARVLEPRSCMKTDLNFHRKFRVLPIPVRTSELRSCMKIDLSGTTGSRMECWDECGPTLPFDGQNDAGISTYTSGPRAVHSILGP